jgi:ribonuclease BN (tRNA processing enzyme)
MMRFTALGTGTVALSPARACAGYLFEDGDAVVLLDCGSGIVRRLAERGDQWQRITHVAITHFHIDHYGDLPTLIFAWKYGMLPARSAAVEVIGPPGTVALIDRLAAAHGEWVNAPGFPLAIRDLAPGERTQLTDRLALSTHSTPHTEESVSYSLECGGRRVVYTGDTGASAPLGEWSRGCDLLVAECSLPESMAIPQHLTPAQCGELAATATPAHLALTHFYPPVEGIDIVAEVRRHYAGPLTLALDGWTFEIEDTACSS